MNAWLKSLTPRALIGLALVAIALVGACTGDHGTSAPDEDRRTRTVDLAQVSGTIALAAMTLRHGGDIFTDMFLLVLGEGLPGAWALLWPRGFYDDYRNWQRIHAIDSARFNERFGLNEPIPVQFAIYLRDLATGDLGESTRTGQPVTEILIDRLPTTVELTVTVAAWAPALPPAPISIGMNTASEATCSRVPSKACVTLTVSVAATSSRLSHSAR